jgi:pyridoxine 4-dehydrogenase
MKNVGRPPVVALGDLSVRRLGLGTMSLTGQGTWGEPRDPSEARRVLRQAVELGVEFFDTADSYGPEVVETLVADTLHPYDGLVVATKAGLTRHGPGRWGRNAGPEYLRDACHASLRRLRVDAVDLFQLHAVDPAVPIEESIGALSELRREGKIRNVGVCNVDSEQLSRARAVESITSVQNRFSLADRSSRDLLEICERDGIAFIAWAPLAKGSLATSAAELDDLAFRRSATTAQVALAWVLSVSPAAMAIPGTSSTVHLQENVGATKVHLTAEDLVSLERLPFAMPVRPGRLGGARRVIRKLVSR